MREVIFTESDEYSGPRVRASQIEVPEEVKVVSGEYADFVIGTASNIQAESTRLTADVKLHPGIEFADEWGNRRSFFTSELAFFRSNGSIVSARLIHVCYDGMLQVRG